MLRIWAAAQSHRCTALYTTVHSNALLYTALHCATLPCTALFWTAQYRYFMFYIALECTGMHCFGCTLLHCTAMHYVSLHCAALHCTALHCTALSCTSLHCNSLDCIVAIIVVLVVQCLALIERGHWYFGGGDSGAWLAATLGQWWLWCVVLKCVFLSWVSLQRVSGLHNG